MSKIKIVDLFAGCGGLTEGFMQTGKYDEIAAVEWLKPQVETLRKRMCEKWGEKDSCERVMQFDIQRESELFSGWNDDIQYGSGVGLDKLISEAGGVDIIIGGPPCQAYSIAGRVRDANGMRDDYRNFLFEHYLSVVMRYRPKMFVFENVPGILSAAPDGILITEKIKVAFDEANYEILDDLHAAVVNASEYGVPQNRNRVVILGLDRNRYNNPQHELKNFYEHFLPNQKTKRIVTVKEAIGDLPKCMPIYDELSHKKRISHSTPECKISWHVPRYSNLRDMETFRVLADDVASGRNEYDSKKISQLYEQKIGSKSPIHRYHVLAPNEPSTTIIAHLYKDGNRFIHYDPEQQRTITVREAARLQSFPDDFDFVGSRGSAYQMIGNAVPVILSKAIATAISYLWEGK